MSNNSNSNRDKQEQLARTWMLMATAVEKALQADAPSASAMAVAHKWLDSNGVNLDVLRSWRNNGLGFDPSTLPTFPKDDHEDYGQAATADPLRRVPDFHDDND